MTKEYIWVDGSGREYQVSGPASASFEAGYLDKCMREHKAAEVLDHADGSVTEEKIAAGAVTGKKLADGSVSRGKLHEDVTGYFAKKSDVEEHFAGREDRHQAKDIDCELSVNGVERNATVAEVAGNHTMRIDGLEDDLETLETALGAKADKQTTQGGFAGGAEARAESGGAAGSGAVAGAGFAGGAGARTAVILGSVDAFGGGEVHETVNVIDAIQLGTGTNSTPNTLQVYDYQLLDEDGNIPAARLANAPGGSGGENASQSVAVTLQASAWSNGSQTLTVSGLTANGNGVISVAPGATAAQRTAARSALLAVTGQSAGSLTIVADGTVPETDIPVVVILFG